MTEPSTKIATIDPRIMKIGGKVQNLVMISVSYSFEVGKSKQQNSHFYFPNYLLLHEGMVRQYAQIGHGGHLGELEHVNFGDQHWYIHCVEQH